MDTIGLRELNQNPSKAVARVRAGVSLIVTDRGTPVLRMVPETEHPSTLQRMITAGTAKPPAEHGVPESECVECNPGLLPRGKDYGWCKRHGVFNCPLEHPEVAQLKTRPKVTPATARASPAATATSIARRPKPGARRGSTRTPAMTPARSRGGGVIAPLRLSLIPI